MARERFNIDIFANDNTRRGFNSLNQSLLGATRGANNLRVALTGAFAGLGVAAIGKDLAIAQRTLESFQARLNFVEGSAEKGAEAFQFVRKAALDLGLDLEVAAKSFGQFAAATQNTSLRGQQTRDAFMAVAKASVVLQLSAEDMQGAFRALEQMISKGNVQAEELRQQLGERFPGAVAIAAQAMGVTTAELNDMMENSELLGEELINKLVPAFEKKFAPAVEDASKTIGAEMNRMSTAFFELRAATADLVEIDNFVVAITMLMNGLKSAVQFLDDLADSTTGFFAIIREGIFLLPKAVAAHVAGFQVAMDGTQAGIAAGAEARKKGYKDFLIAIGYLEEADEKAKGMASLEDAPPIAPPKTVEEMRAFNEAQKARNELITRSKKVLEEIMTPQEKYAQGMRETAELVAADLLTQEQLLIKQGMLQKSYEDATGVTEANRKALEKKNDEEEEAAKVVASLLTPQEANIVQVQRLAYLHDQGRLDATQYAMAVRSITNEMIEALPATKKVKDAQEELAGIFDSVKTPTEKYADEINRIIELFNDLKEAGNGAFEAMGGEEGMGALIGRVAEQFSENRAQMEDEAFKTQLAAAANITTILSSTDDAIAGLQNAFEEGSGIAKAFFLITQSVAAANAIVKGYEAKMSIIAAYAKLGFPGSETVGKVQGNLALMAGFASAGAIMGQTIASFEGGGYTGSGARAGGMDGKGGMLAMVHPNETIIDHEKNGKAAQPVHVNFNIQANDTKDFDRLLVERRGVIVSLINNAVNNRGRRLVE